MIRRLLTQGRKLDVQNPRPSALGSDFGRLGFDLVPAIKSRGEAAEDALIKLDLLVDFRNAVAHGNESALVGIIASEEIKPTLACFRKYRGTLHRLVGTMDRVVAAELAAVLQIQPPW